MFKYDISGTFQRGVLLLDGHFVGIDSPVRIGGVHSVQPQPSADAACDESEASVSITGLAYCTCSGSHSTHLASASSLPSLLSHENDTVVRYSANQFPDIS